MKTDSEKKLYQDLTEKMNTYVGLRDQTIALKDKSSTESMKFFRSNAAPLAAEIGTDTITPYLPTNPRTEKPCPRN